LEETPSKDLLYGLQLEEFPPKDLGFFNLQLEESTPNQRLEFLVAATGFDLRDQFTGRGF
jgi:hypothetical protein